MAASLRHGSTHARVCSASRGLLTSSPNPAGECRTAVARIGASNARIALGLRKALNSWPKGAGGKLVNASQLVSTTRPMREASLSSRNWQMAPPVSLPTRVTSSSSSASMKAMIWRAMPRGDWSACSPRAIVCEPSGQSGA